ncbi:hypothetical protein N9C79_02625 [Acidimicrobiia bacterium]|nr:hypothetical protein [Acidimicrobiia bacterium]
MEAFKVLELEKSYQEKIWKILNKKSLNDLKNAEELLNKDYFEINEIYQITNKVKVLFERITRHHIYINSEDIGIIKTYTSPISSDIAFETHDALIFIDMKTISITGNRNDLKKIEFLPNQITFKNIPMYSGTKIAESGNSIYFDGVVFPHNETNMTRKGMFSNSVLKPILTYFLTLHYYDDGEKIIITQKIGDEDNENKEFSLACMPNYITAEYFWKNDIISDFKTYVYLDTKGLENKFPKYKKKTLKEIENLEKIKLTSKSQKYIYIDTSLKNPIYDINQNLWHKKKMTDPSFYALLSGQSARILKDKLVSNSNEWRFSKESFTN